MNSLVSATSLATATAIPALAHVDDDPIFAAIEAHCEATMRLLRHSDAWMALSENDSGYAEGELGYKESTEAHDDAAAALTNVRPTTMAGVLALLDHIDQFNRGAFNLGKRLSGTEHHQWLEDLVDDDIQDVWGRGLKMPFPYWVMRNVANALRTIQGMPVSGEAHPAQVAPYNGEH